MDIPRLNCTQVNSLTKDKFLIVWVLFFSVIHQFLMMITELLIEKGIKRIIETMNDVFFSVILAAVCETGWFLFFLFSKSLYHVMSWAFSP